MKPELWAFFVSALIACAQVVLLKRLFLSLTTENRKLTFLLAVIKFVSYGIILYFLIFEFLPYFMYCFCGFVAGLPIAAFITFVCATRYNNKRRFRG